jgi:hypothetical protein
VAPVTHIDIVVTDSSAPPAEVDAIRSVGVDVRVVQRGDERQARRRARGARGTDHISLVH